MSIPYQKLYKRRMLGLSVRNVAVY